MLSALRLAGVAVVALLAGMSVSSNSPSSSMELAGEYEWRMLDPDEYASVVRRDGANDAVIGTLVLIRNLTGYDAHLTSSMPQPLRPFLVSIVQDRVIVYADSEVGELRFDLPSKPDVPAEWTLRSEEWGELHGRLSVTKR